jgi:lipid II:glycine glycyltransferase (peptidoglycan interpeptide bridge formation enzyme)
MTARYATTEEIANWDTSILANPDGGNVFSSFEYGEIKKLTRYTPRYVFVTILEKYTPPLGKLWYIPKGPNVTSSISLFDALEAIKPLAKKAGVFVIKVESELDKAYQPALSSYGLIKAAAIIPNPSTITLDISSTLEEVLMALPQKGRHAIRKAQRDGVTITSVPTTDENCKIMYTLLSDTAKGQFGIRSFDYYKKYWQSFDAAQIGQLFFAHFEGKIVAGAYAMTFGTKSTYKDGASVRERTAYGASHLLQWKVIEWAKSRGVTLHDFCGSPPSDEINNKNHPHYGVGMFKTAFNKTVTDYVGCYDYVIQPLKYAIWSKIGERVYRKVYYKRTHDYYY